MSVDKKLAELEALAKQIEGEKSFDKTLDRFTKAATLVKDVLEGVGKERGRVTEIIRDIDGAIEREIKFDATEDEE
ncbi:MAG: hypothetical protein FWE38_01480 [Firmicutes bacterium]|nr:hypothetical protein [Bacillota bacterium]